MLEDGMSYLEQRAEQMQAEGVRLGGAPHLFEKAGRLQLMCLLSEGLLPDSKVLDIGCGSLRGGYWLLHFLKPHCYFGIEPHVPNLEGGLKILMEPEIVQTKAPQFSHNSDFDFSVFNQKFDYFVARSIWSHASKSQIETMLDSYVATSNPSSVFLASYVPTKWSKYDYKGTEWVGKSHESDSAGIIHHKFGWIKKQCELRGLIAQHIDDRVFNFGNQKWLRIKRRPDF